MDATKEKKGFIRGLTNILVRFVKNYLPSPFTLAVSLSLIIFILGMTVGGMGFMEMVNSFGAGMFSLFPFTMQMVLVLVTGHVLASSPFVVKILKKIAILPKNKIQAVMFTAFVSYLCSYLNWGFGLIAGAIVAKEMAKQNYGKKIHYPLMIAAAYSGNIARGPSSSIPLAVATPGHIMESVTGIIPVSQTLYAPYNILLTLLLLVSIPVLFKLMTPPDSESIELSPDKFGDEEAVARDNKKVKKTFAEIIDTTPVLALIVGVIWVIYLVAFFKESASFNLNLNIVILIFFTLGIFAQGNLENYANAVGNAVKTSGGIVLQFPFYAAIMAMMRDSGLAVMMSEWFIAIANEKTLPVLTFWSAGLVNIFVPSGGGQWAVQGPIMIEAAAALGADPGRVTMALAWGDSWTNQIQPFWALPALAIAGLDVKDIMGYCIMVLLLSGIIISGVFAFL